MVSTSKGLLKTLKRTDILERESYAPSLTCGCKKGCGKMVRVTRGSGKGEREMAEVKERAAKSVRNTGGGGWLGNRSDGVVNMQP